MKCSLKLAVLLLFLLSIGRATLADETSGWPQFRGYGGTAYVSDGVLPGQWSADDYRWQIELPGGGVGSPVIHGQRAYLINAEPESRQRTVLSLDLENGQIVWQAAFPLVPHHLHARNSYASTTPYVDSSGIYVAWADPEQVTLAAIELDGTTRWVRDLGPWQSQHGFGGSPVMHDGKLIFFNSQQADQLDPGQRPGESRMMAFDPSSGETLWSTELPSTRACYGVPNLYVAQDGSRQLVASDTGSGLFGLDLETGEMLWSNPVFSARTVSSPLVIGDLIIGSAGSGGGGNHLVAIRPAITEPTKWTSEEVYRIEKYAPYVPTVAIRADRLYSVDDKGIAACFDASTGEEIWHERLGGGFSASPIIVGDKVLAINMEGTATIFATSDQYQKLGSVELGGPVQATPAYSSGHLIIRAGNTIFCL
jgi:outer membrane protein assembly factor BamB